MDSSSFYHIYNRGNNRQKIFFQERNYSFFLTKVRRHFLRHLDILSYCLMPNHFHFLVYTKDDLVPGKFSNDLKIMLRSYTRAINNQENRVGSLFQQNTKIKPLESYAMTSSHGIASDSYPITCFHYIHQNPVKAGLVRTMEDWKWSSYRHYSGMEGNDLSNRALAIQILDIPASGEEFTQLSNQVRIDQDF